jgi:uncharacterized protein
MEDITFEVDGLKLKGNIFYPEEVKEKNPAILFVQGWTGNRKRSFQYAESLAKLGYICMLYDNRGHGESEGDIKTFTIKEFLDDVLAAYDYLSKIKGVDGKNISAVGSSFGGYLVSLLSEKKDVKNLVLRVPADYSNTDFEKIKFVQDVKELAAIIDWRKIPKKANETYALNALNGFSGKVLIIESENDDMVPHETIQNYINAVENKEKLIHVLMKNAPHSIKEGPFRDEVTRILVDWFKTKI